MSKQTCTLEELPESEFLRIKEQAVFLRIGTRRLRQLIEDDDGPNQFWLTPKIRVSTRDECTKWIMSRKKQPPKMRA